MSRAPMEENICAVANCDRTVYAKSLCNRHYQQMRRTKKGQRTVSDIIDTPADRYNKPKPKCKYPGCSRTRTANGYCNMHFQRSKNNFEPRVTMAQTPCKIDGCTNMSRTRNMCNRHYQAWFRENLQQKQVQSN